MVQFGNPRSGLEAGRTPGAAVFGAGNGKQRGCIEWLFKCLLFLGGIAAQATGYREPALSSKNDIQAQMAIERLESPQASNTAGI